MGLSLGENVDTKTPKPYHMGGLDLNEPNFIVETIGPPGAMSGYKSGGFKVGHQPGKWKRVTRDSMMDEDPPVQGMELGKHVLSEFGDEIRAITKKSKKNSIQSDRLETLVPQDEVDDIVGSVIRIRLDDTMNTILQLGFDGIEVLDYVTDGVAQVVLVKTIGGSNSKINGVVGGASTPTSLEMR
ncbi:hypothetical protein QYF36_012416 [Acer negundo]|nr:hypothetical protein QYF36_012416 [Acer negundo]